MFAKDGLNHLWNEMMKDGELVQLMDEGSSSDELRNSTGAVTRQGSHVHVICVYF